MTASVRDPQGRTWRVASKLLELRGRWVVVADGERERWSWNVRGRTAARRLAADVAEALRAGADLPLYGRFEGQASARPLSETDVARRTPGPHVRVLRAPQDAEAG